MRKEIILAVGGCLIVMMVAGCEEQNLSAAKKGRLAAYENKHLKEQLAQQEKKSEEQKAQQEKKFEEQLAQQEKKIKEQNKLLSECQQRKEILEKRFEAEVDARISETVGFFGYVNEQLKQENDQLNARKMELEAQVEELKTKVSRLEQQLKIPITPPSPSP